MKRLLIAACCLPALALTAQFFASPASAQTQTTTSTERLSGKDLRAMLVGLGFEEVKDISTVEGKEKFEVTVKGTSFNVPVALEISPSRRFVWLTALLGSFTTKHSGEALLRKNAEIQPSQFYVTKANNLQIALAAENRNVTSANLKFCMDKLVQDVSDSASVWNIK